MKYNGREVEEANGTYYHLGMTPKRMFVWNFDDDAIIVEREVLGFFQGTWIAANNEGTGVTQWRHAAEIPKPTVRSFTSAEELDKAIAKHGPWVLGVTSDTRNLITSYGNSSVRVDGDGYTMVTMMKEFNFLDGAPFGVEENQ